MKNRVHGMMALAGVLLTAGTAFPAQQAASDVTTEVYAGQPLQKPSASLAPSAPLGTVLYSNGPYITHPAGGFGGADASAIQSSLGMTLFGSNQSLSGGFRIADDFVVPAGGWTIDTVTLFAYQTLSTTTSTINHVNVRIWNGPPNDPLSMVVFGDTTTNRLASSVFSNVFRVTETTLTNNQRPVMEQTVTIGTTLAAGTYWLDWQTGGTLASGPWQPPVTIMGQTNTGNALQLVPPATWQPMLDVAFPQGALFILNGPLAATVAPISLAVDAAGNGVLEPNEASVSVAPSWQNTGAGAIASLDGTLTNFVGPAGATYNLSDASASYGAVAAGATASCTATGNCYQVTVDATTRPVVHWDSTISEIVNPSATTKDWTLHIGGSFTDVPTTSGFYRFVETILHNNVTSGCSATAYCPSADTTRDQMAVFVLVSNEAPGYVPAACGATPMFTDVPVTSGFCRWVEELARRGVVGGCGPSLYCPTAPATREQMAVFVLRTLDPALSPPACVTPMFNDVPAANGFCRWIEELARRGVVTGCGGGNYCPTAPVTREQMGVFLTVTFSLTLYGL